MCVRDFTRFEFKIEGFSILQQQLDHCHLANVYTRGICLAARAHSGEHNIISVDSRLTPANERRRYFVTTSLIGCAPTYKQLCTKSQETVTHAWSYQNWVSIGRMLDSTRIKPIAIRVRGGLIRTHGLYSLSTNTSFCKIAQSNKVSQRDSPWNSTGASALVKFQSDWTTNSLRRDFARSGDDKFNILCSYQKRETRYG